MKEFFEKNKIFFGIIILAFIVGGAIYLSNSKSDTFSKFRDYIDYFGPDGWSSYTSQGASFDLSGTRIEAYTGAVLNNVVKGRTECGWIKLVETGKKIVVDFPIVYIKATTALTAQLFLLRDAKHNIEVDLQTETDEHFGWKIVNADLYATNADGITQSITDTKVDLTPGSQLTRLRIELLPGDNCKFYVNDVLKVTHTTNLPPDGNYHFHLVLKTGEATEKRIDVGRILIEKDY